MALLDDLNNPDLLDVRSGVVCSVCKLLRDLDADTKTKLSALLADPEIPKSRLAAILNANGHKMNGNTLSRHARGECRGARG
jgi:hypothetical protein